MINILLKVVAFELIHFRFRLEASYVQVKCISFFYSLSIFPIRLVNF